MTVTQATLIQRVRNLLQDNPWATTGSAASSVSVIAVPDGTRWDEGVIGEFQDTGEQFWVQSVSVNNLTTLRGFNGTTAATHASTTIVRDPTFSYKQIADGLDLQVLSLWPYVYKKVTVQLSSGIVTTPYKWYDLGAAADAMALISVVQVDTAVTPARLYRYGVRGSGRPVSFSRNLPTTLVANGTGVMFPRGLVNTNNVQVDYAAQLTTTGSYTDLTDGILADIVTYGVAARLVIGSDIPRSTQTDVNMGDSSVVSGMRAALGRQFYQQFLLLRNQYHEELTRTLPLVGMGVGGFGSGNLRMPPYP